MWHTPCYNWKQPKFIFFESFVNVGHVLKFAPNPYHPYIRQILWFITTIFKKWKIAPNHYEPYIWQIILFITTILIKWKNAWNHRVNLMIHNHDYQKNEIINWFWYIFFDMEKVGKGQIIAHKTTSSCMKTLSKVFEI
jgi:hypothetical protein